MGAQNGDCRANHHLIPEEIMKDAQFKDLFDRLQNIGWDGDGASNGTFLPGSKDLASTMGLPGHWSNHAQYTDAVVQKVSIFNRNLSVLSDLDLALGIKRIQDWSRHGLDNRLFRVDSQTGRLI